MRAKVRCESLQSIVTCNFVRSVPPIITSILVRLGPILISLAHIFLFLCEFLLVEEEAHEEAEEEAPKDEAEIQVEQDKVAFRGFLHCH